MPKIYTIAQVIATPEGQYVSAEVFAVMSNIQAPRGRGPWTATLTDQTGSIMGKFWGGDISYWAGKRMKLSGKGMQRKEYKGVPELSVGDKVNISFAGAPGTAAQEEETMPGDPLPPPPRYNAAPLPSQPARQIAPTASGTPAIPHGATIGMCVKGALDIWLATSAVEGWNANSVAFVYGTANQLLSICKRVEDHAATTAEDSSVPF